MADELEEEGFVPSGAQKFSWQQYLGIGVCSSDVVGQSSKDGEVGWFIVFAVACEIFTFHDLKHPSEAVLDALVCAHDG